MIDWAEVTRDLQKAMGGKRIRITATKQCPKGVSV